MHIRTLSDKSRVRDIRGELISFFGGIDFQGDVWEKQLKSPDRLYIGDEFCPIRKPDLVEIKGICRFARESHMGLTLLTPILTEPWLDKYISVFECLKTEFSGAEIVVNDLGVLFFLGAQYPEFHLSLGRLLNKGFKDPRLSLSDIETPEKTKALLSDCTFDHPEFQQMAVSQGVTRLERDLLPYADRIFDTASELNTSCYFPFGYVTTGRVCWTATLNRASAKGKAGGENPGGKFIPLKGCPRPCDSLPLELKHESLSFKLFQSGNTIFYLYTLPMLTALLKKAETENIRLVYQGGLL